jgi:outer membrane cobalamin receptor
MSFQNDTIRINEVIISRNKVNNNLSGYKNISIDSAILKNYSQGTLAEMISENSTIFIKSYGMGGVATPSFRGTGASHTQLAWNDININSPMLGQSDFSIIPAGLIDDVRIYYGGASMVLNSGGIGGIINMETKPLWKKETLISINSGLGSYGRYSGLVKVRSGNTHFQTVTKLFMQKSDNNFRYLNTESSVEPFWETRNNNQVKQNSFIQELYYRRSSNVISARIWFQSANRNLPPPLGTEDQVEKQFDESLRSMLNFDGSKGRLSYFFTGAFLVSKLNYSNRLVKIDSRNLSETLVSKAGMEYRIGEFTKTKMVLNNELNVVKSNNYIHNQLRNTASLTASAERNRNDRFATSILVREILLRNTLLVPDFSAGMQFRLSREGEYYLKANASRNSKIPAMNDMFWLLSGNPELKNEYAFVYELTYEMKQKISLPLNLSYSLSVFNNSIKDMIQWQPGENAYWIPDNIPEVYSAGMESSLALDYSSGNVTSRFSAGYSYTKASLGSGAVFRGKQVIYIPENQANISLRISYRNFYYSWFAYMTGIRYTRVDNSEFLPGYCINNLLTGVKLKIKGTPVDMNISIDNLLNASYQTIAHYPLPGRTYSFKILVQILK